jgi:chromosome segregation ATPase
VERELTAARAEITELLRQSAAVRTILSGTDIGSLPHDWTLEQLAETRWKDLAETREKNVELHAWADSMLRKIEDLEARLTATQEYGTQARLRENKAEDARVHLSFELEKAQAQITEQDFIIQQTQIDRDTWRSNYHGEAEKLTALAARHEKALIAGANMRVALADLTSWFPDKPTQPEWRLTAGVYGADEAIKAAQQILGNPEEKTDE